MNKENLETLIQLMNDNQLQVISVKDGDTEYHLEKAAAPVQQTAVQPAAQPAAQLPAAAQPAQTEAGHVQHSMLVGTFYLTENEGAAPFVKVGDKVNKGDRIGIIEAMKVMNDIQAEVSGTVEEIYVESGTAVGYEEPLIRIVEG